MYTKKMLMLIKKLNNNKVRDVLKKFKIETKFIRVKTPIVHAKEASTTIVKIRSTHKRKT